MAVTFGMAIALAIFVQVGVCPSTHSQTPHTHTLPTPLLPYRAQTSWHPYLHHTKPHHTQSHHTQPHQPLPHAHTQDVSATMYVRALPPRSIITPPDHELPLLPGELAAGGAEAPASPDPYRRSSRRRAYAGGSSSQVRACCVVEETRERKCVCGWVGVVDIRWKECISCGRTGVEKACVLGAMAE